MASLLKDNPNHFYKEIALANEFLSQGEFAKAEALFEKVIEPYKNLSRMSVKSYVKSIFKGLEQRKLLAEAYYGLGLCAINDGSLKEAVNRLRLALESFEKEKMVAEQARCYSAMGDAYRVAFDFDVAEEMYRSAMKIYIKHNLHEALSDAYVNIGIIYNARERYDVALSWYRDAIEISKRISNEKTKATALKKIALCYQQQGLVSEAIRNYNLSAKIYKSLNQYDELAQIYADAAFITKNISHFALAENLANKSIIYADKGGLIDNKFMALLELGDINSRKNEFNKAESFYKQAIKLIEALPNANLAVAYNNLGSLYLKNNHLDEAEKMFYASLNLEQKDKRSLSVAYDFANIGIVEFRRGNIEKACNNWNRAKKYFADAGEEQSLNEMQALLDEHASDDMYLL